MGYLMVMLLSVPASMWRGFVLAKLWLWFAVPIGAPRIGYVTAIGLSMLVAMLTAGTPPRSDTTSDTEGAASMFGRLVVGPAFGAAVVLGIGWLWSLAL